MVESQVYAISTTFPSPMSWEAGNRVSIFLAEEIWSRFLKWGLGKVAAVGKLALGNVTGPELRSMKLSE